MSLQRKRPAMEVPIRLVPRAVALGSGCRAYGEVVKGAGRKGAKPDMCKKWVFKPKEDF